MFNHITNVISIYFFLNNNLLVFNSFSLKHKVDFLCRCGSLQLLTIEHFFLQLGNALNSHNIQLNSIVFFNVIARADATFPRLSKLGRLIEYLLALHESLGNTSITTTIASCDEIGDTTAFEKRRQFGTRIE